MSRLSKGNNRTKHKSGYQVRTTTNHKTKKSKRKQNQRDFEGKGLNDTTAQLGIREEYSSQKQKTWIFAGGILLGFVLLILDIRDNGMLIKVGNMSYTGSLSGGAIVIGCFVAMTMNKAKVKLSK